MQQFYSLSCFSIYWLNSRKTFTPIRIENSHINKYIYYSEMIVYYLITTSILVGRKREYLLSYYYICPSMSLYIDPRRIFVFCCCFLQLGRLVKIGFCIYRRAVALCRFVKNTNTNTHRNIHKKTKINWPISLETSFFRIYPQSIE